MPISVDSVSAAVNNQITIGENLPQPSSPDPLIPRDEVIPPASRPLSPRDHTQITLHGVAIDRNTIVPIALDTDSDDETEDNIGNIIDLAARIPIFIPGVSDTTTVDTSDGTFRRNLEGDIIARPPGVSVSSPTECSPILVTPSLIPTVPNETIIRPASPVTQVTIPIAPDPLITTRNIINSVEIKPLTTINGDSIINPAPPVASVTINRNVDTRPTIQPIQPPIATRQSRGRQSIPITSQPTLVASPTLQQTPQTQSSSQQTSSSSQQTSSSSQSIRSTNTPRASVQSTQQNIPPSASVQQDTTRTNDTDNRPRHAVRQTNDNTQPTGARHPVAVQHPIPVQQTTPVNTQPLPQIPPTVTARQNNNIQTPNGIRAPAVPQAQNNLPSQPIQQNIPPPASAVRAPTQHTPVSTNQHTPVRAPTQQTPVSTNQHTPVSANQQTPTSANQQTPTSANQQTPTSANQQTPTNANQQTPTSANQQTPTSAARTPTQQNIPPPASAGRAPQSTPGGLRVPQPIPANTQTSTTGFRVPQPNPANTQSNTIPVSAQQNPTVHQNIPPPVSAQQNIPPPISAQQNIPPPVSAQQNIPPSASTAGGGIRRPISVTQTGGIRQPIPVDNRTKDTTTDTQPLPSEIPASEPAPAVQVPNLPPPNIPNYAAMSLEEQAQHRANFRTRFGILRNAWPNYHIPDVPDNVPLEQVHAQYDIYVRHIHISQDVDQYKVYLVIMWLLIELFCTKIGLNIGGYTVAQMRSMNKYERLLIELGETNYKTSGGAAAAQSSWPIEIRIFFMALVNAVTFIIIKMLAGYIGEGMATTIVDGLSSYLSGTPPQPGQVLFGGPSQAASGATPQNGAPGPGPMPQMGGPFGGIDVASLLGNLGSMFIRGQAPTAAAAAPVAQATAPVQTSQGPATPRFRPAYDD
ncbi:Hypothetical protein HVR_LOCUS1330 [uncultured virus]|nr:Hypothetical protein HVR_LOCUS1330 [uncultured virus]